MKTTEQAINEIREQLRLLYKNDNEAPRLIAEMLREFPRERGKEDPNDCPTTHNLG